MSSSRQTQRVRVIDSHTGGEPTRVVIDGAPDLGRGSLAERRDILVRQFDDFRSGVVCEPRGSDILVGALLCEPVDPTCAAGVIFFNNVGPLGMCGHGMIGVAATLAHLDRLSTGLHRVETPVGVVEIQLHDPHRVTIENVVSERYRASVPVEVPGHGVVRGDIAWGGNWFFLISAHGLPLRTTALEQLTGFTRNVRYALANQGITGRDGAEIDHIELLGPPVNPSANARNFVLCPGFAYDRSPCGTGTSAKVACLHAEGRLREGEVWRQESITGSIFDAGYRLSEDRCKPWVRGEAFVTAEATLVFEPGDPLCGGARIVDLSGKPKK